MRSVIWRVAERLVLRTPLRRTMLTASLPQADEAAFGRLVQAVDEAGGREVAYDATAPKHDFFRHLLARRQVLCCTAPATGRSNASSRSPRRTTTTSGRSRSSQRTMRSGRS